MLAQVQDAWRALEGDQKRAALAAIGLLVCMFLPWYEQRTVGVGARGRLLVPSTENLNAFGVFTFIEAAVLLVALGVLALLYARGRGARFELPGGDGTVIAAAGMWAALLFFIRLFDKPNGDSTDRVTVTVGIQWGFLVAFVAAGALCAAGLRLRAGRRRPAPLVRRGAHHDEPPTAATAVTPRRRAQPEEQLSLDDPAPTAPLRPGEVPPAPERGTDP